MNLLKYHKKYTLVYTFYDISKDSLVQIMDEIILELNQSSILVEEEKVYYTYYYGANK